MGKEKIEAHLFGNMEDDDNYDYYQRLIGEFSAQDGDKENYLVLEKTIQIYAMMLS